jgi:hypothetical protein
MCPSGAQQWPRTPDSQVADRVRSDFVRAGFVSTVPRRCRFPGKVGFLLSLFWIPPRHKNDFYAIGGTLERAFWRPVRPGLKKAEKIWTGVGSDRVWDPSRAPTPGVGFAPGIFLCP